VPVVAHAMKDGHAIVDVLNECVTLRVRTDPVALGERDPGPPPPPLASALAPEHVVAAGTPAVWADGTPAGTFAREHTYEDTARRALQKGKRCFGNDDRTSSLEPFAICVAAKSVETRDPLGVTAIRGTLHIGVLGALSEPSDSGIAELYAHAPADELDMAVGGGWGAAGRGGAGPGGGGALLGSADVGEDVEPRVRMRGLHVDGGLDPARVRAELPGLAGSVRDCIAAAGSGARGKLSVEATIGSDGTPRNVQVTGVAELDDCVKRSIEQWSWPESSTSTDIAFTIVVAGS
jgi:hypothetical protein